MHARRGGSRSGGWRAAAIGLLLGAGTLGAQGLPAIEQVFELRTARIDSGSVRAVEVQDVSSRLLTEAELEALALGDADLDSVPNVRDACPLNPFCQDHEALQDLDGDGVSAWKDVDDTDAAVHLTGNPAIDAWPTTDDFTGPMALVQTTEEILDWILLENSSKGLYSQERIIEVAGRVRGPALPGALALSPALQGPEKEGVQGNLQGDSGARAWAWPRARPRRAQATEGKTSAEAREEAQVS